MGALNLLAADLVFGFKTTCKRLQVRFDRGNCSLTNDHFKLNLDGPGSTRLVC